MKIAPYLMFSGQCEAAFKFYERCFRGKIAQVLKHGESPEATKVAPEWRDKVMHVRLDLGNGALMGCDAPPEHYKKPQGHSVTLSVTTPAEADRIFGELAQQGTVQLPIQQTFWSPRFGMVTDRFGIPWFVNCEPAA